jgi:hypothetical protein
VGAASGPGLSIDVSVCKECGGPMRVGFVAMLFTNAITARPKIESRSKIGYRGAVSYGNASRRCSMTQSAVEQDVAPSCKTRRRSWRMTKKP